MKIFSERTLKLHKEWEELPETSWYCDFHELEMKILSSVMQDLADPKYEVNT